MSVVLYGMMAWLVSRAVLSGRPRMAAALLAAALVVVIGFSRIYLQVHYLSDVLAGLAAGTFWLAACLTVLKAAGTGREP